MEAWGGQTPTQVGDRPSEWGQVTEGVDLDQDFITQFMEATATTGSPERFRQWTGISIIAAAAERRVWVQTGARQTFPNSYIFLVAAPGVGKQIIDDARDLVGGLHGAPIHVSPNSMTKASLVDELVKAKGTVIPPNSPPFEYHSLYAIEEEAQVLMPSYDSDFLGIVNKLYNNPVIPFTETRRTGSVKSVSAQFPQLNLLMGVQPGWMAGTFPELAWATGLMARVVMVYVEEQEVFDFWEEVEQRPGRQGWLEQKLLATTRRFGPMVWEPAALADHRAWHMNGQKPRPTHSKLEHYARRRTLHLTKLALISALSRGPGREIGTFDLARARRWLFDVEAVMPDIFRAMTGKSDLAVIEELHYYITNLWKMNGGKAVAGQSLHNFLTRFVISERIEKVLLAAERSNVIARVAGTETYLPRPKHLHGVE